MIRHLSQPVPELKNCKYCYKTVQTNKDIQVTIMTENHHHHLVLLWSDISFYIDQVFMERLLLSLFHGGKK